MKKIIARTTIPISSEELKSLFNRVTLKDVTTFEHNLGTYLGVKTVSALDSGRSALALALRLFKLKPGEKVLLPAFVCPILYDVILSMGLKPIPVDVSFKTYNIDISQIKKAQIKDVRLMIIVHLFGKSCNMDEIIEFTNNNGLYLIEDAAQALGAEYKGKKIGTFGDVSILSFGLGKVITGGSGGAIIINNSEFLDDLKLIKEKILFSKLSTRLNVTGNIIIMNMLSNFYIYSILREPINSFFDEIDYKIIKSIQKKLIDPKSVKNKYIPYIIHSLSAKITNFQLEKLDKFNKKRIYYARQFSEMLREQNVVQFQSEEYFKNNIFSRFPLKTVDNSFTRRDLILNKLLQLGIDAEKPYFALKRILPTFEETHNSINLTDTMFTLPNSPCLSPNDVDFIGKAALGILKSMK